MNLRRAIAIAALAAALAFVFYDQVSDPGFRRGHRGWVSAHTLAIAQKASPENGFVGYTISLATPAGRELYYFDRYPVFFSAALHSVQAAAQGKAGQIHVARQVMNLVYVLTVLAAVALLVELGLTLEAAVAASAFAAAGSTMVEYRDMVHYDQPAVLGSVLLLWAVARWSRTGLSRAVYVATAVAVCLGRGYASFVILGLWWLFEAARILRAREQAPAFSRTMRTMRTLLLGVPARACLLGILVAGACLAYNVRAEARAREVSWTETSIVRSAKRRLSLDTEFNEQKERRLTWPPFMDVQQENFARGIVPWSRRDPLRHHKEVRTAIAVIVAVVALGFALSRPRELRVPWMLMCLSGPLWLAAMRNLTAFHPYTAVFLYPMTLVGLAALLHPLARRWQWIAALAACTLLIASTSQRNDALARDKRFAVQDTRDMERVRAVLERRDAVAVDQRVFRGVPYALGFYLPDHDLVVEGPASLVLTRDRKFRGENLTPANAGIFLFRPARLYLAHSSLARLHPASTAARQRTEQPVRERRHRPARVR